MPVKAIYCKEEELKLAVTVLEKSSYDFLKEAERLERSEIPIINEATGALTADHLRKTANKHLAAAQGIQWSIEGLVNQPTPDEEKEELRKLLDELHEGIGRKIYGRGLVDSIRDCVEEMKSERKEAFGLVATLVDDQRVRLEAFRWILNSALSSPTHASKNARLRLALESLQEIVNEIQKIDPDNIDGYGTYDWHLGSWNTRKLNADIYYKDMQIRRLQEELEALRKEKAEKATLEGINEPSNS
jgi:hypothetical protein